MGARIWSRTLGLVMVFMVTFMVMFVTVPLVMSIVLSLVMFRCIVSRVGCIVRIMMIVMIIMMVMLVVFVVIIMIVMLTILVIITTIIFVVFVSFRFTVLFSVPMSRPSCFLVQVGFILVDGRTSDPLDAGALGQSWG